MSEIAKKHTEQLDRIKKNIEKSYLFFRDNYNRFHMMKRFFYKSTLSEDEESVLTELKKPIIEVNIGNAYISRQLGEFSKQEPSIETRTVQDAPINPALPRLIDGAFRKILDDAHKDGTEYNIHKDTLGGGFSVYKVSTEYESEKSFKQKITLSKCNNPTLVGFDPLAQLRHKGDAEYCFESSPMLREAFEKEYPNIRLDKMSFQRAIEGYSWSYKTSKEDIILVCDYYEKVSKKEKILELSDGQVMTPEEYEKFSQEWEEKGMIAQLPIVANKRKTYFTKVVRYRLIETQIIDYQETIFKDLPFIFTDGDSEWICNGMGMPIEQFTKPYLWGIVGIQKFKNFALQNWANEMENTTQQKWIAAKEAIPPEYKDAYNDPQRAAVLVFNAFKKDDPTVPLPPPREAQRVPMPPEISAAFTVADQTAQTVLGSYDASLGINNNQLSGIAIQEGATQSNSAAMPYIVGHLQALTQVANVIKNIMPIVYANQKSIAVLTPEKEVKSMPINQPDGVDMNFAAELMKIEVKAGVNFAIQKSRALQELQGLMQTMPAFSELMNVNGLGIILDNVDIRGIDQVKEAAKQFMQQKAQEQKMQQQMQMQQMQQAQNQPNPIMEELKLENKRIEQKERELHVESQIKMAKLELEKKSIENKHLKALLDIQQKGMQNQINIEKTQVDGMMKAADLDLKAHDIHHRHAK